MRNSQIHQLATICSRYTHLNNVANTAYDSLTKLNFALFEDTLTPIEIKSLNDARDIADRVRSKTTTQDAIRYFNSIQQVEQ